VNSGDHFRDPRLREMILMFRVAVAFLPLTCPAACPGFRAGVGGWQLRAGALRGRAVA